MTRRLIALPLLSLAACCLAEEPMCRLPRPHYHRDSSDPDWLSYAAQFHGHLGPWAAAGARLGMAGIRAVGAQGYFDVEVTCHGPFGKPPKSCFLDGLQVATGATLGKRNLHWVQGDDIVVSIKNTHSGKACEVRPTESLLQVLGSLPKAPAKTAKTQTAHDREDHAVESVETLARQVAAMPHNQIIVVTFP